MTQPLRALCSMVSFVACPTCHLISFRGPDGAIPHRHPLLQIVMFVTATITAAILLVSYFRRVTDRHVREGLLLGLLWLAMNLVLDVAVLVPMTGMSLRDYAVQIGFGYLAIPVITLLVGKVLADQPTKARSTT